MGDSRRPTPSHRLDAYCTVIVRVSYGYGYTRGSGRVWVEIFDAGRVRVRVVSSATGTGRVAEIVDPHTPSPDGSGQRPDGSGRLLVGPCRSDGASTIFGVASSLWGSCWARGGATPHSVLSSHSPQSLSCPQQRHQAQHPSITVKNPGGWSFGNWQSHQKLKTNYMSQPYKSAHY